MKKLLAVLAIGSFVIQLHAQKSDVTALFRDEKPLDIKLKVSIKDIKKKTNDSTYLPAMFYAKNESGAWDSVKIGVRARGIYRRKNCFFTPIRIKASKNDTKGTILDGNKSLKLVMPCKDNEGKNPLVMREYVAYKMYEAITPYYFNTRQVNIDFTDVDGKKNKNYQLTGILIEDDDVVARRHHAKIMENMNLHPLALNDTAALRHDLFQLMVANTDWSTAFLHNAKLMFIEPRKYIPLTYDFDMSGFVNPPYAEVAPELGITSVRDRLYRGFCRKEPVTQMVRKQFIDLEPTIMGIVGKYEKDFSAKDNADMKKFLGEFFSMMKDDGQFKKMVLEGCRKK
jgi:hypothetical protein